ncbi:glucose-1-phosphate adenylyltransferase [Paenibacillus sp. J31TS4]|uniref:glucose-1-phosphate adenylyltransferase subunit GlgD n=1 Tax=Paenibacillus sp. J31TS4 TaxID=2807195 RepID=UPI001B0FD282|nr:glucose-1-phosphate adenylyltransferase subunit GlgD [Paenibacillus sp. J31TS4]GIP37388.1 glucose-1-phosphate adenylyltransferase [Paenibacillus sp. J31TS4]
MKQVLGVINLVNELDDLEELTYNRTIASVPFGGRYRLIDFILSSMVNSDIHSVAVFAHTKYRSLMDHIGSGREWDLARKRSGLFLLPPAVEEVQEMLKGDLYYFHKHRDFFYRSSQEYVVIARSHMVCNINLKEVVNAHIERGADITMVYQQSGEPQLGKCRRIETDAEGRVTDILDHFGPTNSEKISLDIFVMRKDLLLDLVETSLAKGYDHFTRNAIMNNRERLKIYGYAYKGYLGVVNTIPAYFKHSMDLLNPDIWTRLFYDTGNQIYTKIKDEPPCHYTEQSHVANSLIANGCRIEGEVENSIVFRGVKIGKGAKIRNSIVMQNCVIGEDVSLENAILDKDVTVGRGSTLKGSPNAPFLAPKRKRI